MSNLDWTLVERQFRQGDPIIDRIRNDRLELLRFAAEKQQARTQLEDWEDLGNFEDATKREYSGRFLFELLQNANDAIVDWLESHPEGSETPTTVRIILSDQSLLVANHGLPFTEKNVEAICRLGKTTKSASKSIGHKGVGFKSVLEVSDSPEIYSQGFAFGFSRKDCLGAIRQIIGDDFLDEQVVPIHRFPFPRSLERLDPDERTCIAELFAEGYVTVVRLPLSGPSETIAQQLHDLEPYTLLFLTGIDCLEVSLPRGSSFAFRQVAERTPERKEKSYGITLQVEKDGGADPASNWLVLKPDPIPVTDRTLLEPLGQAWKQITHVSFAFALPLDDEGNLRVEDKTYRFYVYFPTTEDSGLRFMVNADFYIAASRKHIPPNDFNLWLTHQVTCYLASEGINQLKARYPDQSRIVDILAPAYEPHEEFGQPFYKAYLSELRRADFVPLGNNIYAPPEKVRLTPEGTDAGKFRKFFTPEQLSVDDAWAYPLLEVEEAEDRRKHPFLTQIGTRRLELDDILFALSAGPRIPAQQCREFIAFLTEWWRSLNPYNDYNFIAKLGTVKVIPTTEGWRRPPSDDELVFQANLRPDAPQVPKGFDFQIVVPEAYGTKGATSQEHSLLERLGVIDYDAREIARRAILPVFEDQKRFDNLSLESIRDAYEFLKQNKPEVESRGNVLLPARRLNDATLCWQPAKSLYFTQHWTGNDDLDLIYGQFDDVYFLDRVEMLGDLSDDVKQEWFDFFCWLGVAYCPRLNTAADRVSGNSLRNWHSFSAKLLWKEYLEHYWQHFECGNSRHSYSLQFDHVEEVEKFEEIVAGGDRQILARLFRAIAANWHEVYFPRINARISCTRSRCGVSRLIPNYFANVLKKAEWIPAITRGMDASHLLPPSEVWTLGPAEPQAIQRMVPVLPPELRDERFRLFRAELGFMDSSKATFDDYLALLRRLPDLYPSKLPDVDESVRNQWHRDLRAVFNWLCQSMQTILASGNVEIPSRPSALQVLAFAGEALHFVDINDKKLVYPDDNYLATRWSDTCYFLRIDEDWRKLREWLCAPNLSDVIESKRKPVNDLAQQTEETSKKFNEMLPFFLTLIDKTQHSRLEDLAGRLRRLQIHVVEELWIEQTLREVGDAKSYQEQVYLETHDVPGWRGGTMRVGDLYIQHQALTNLDLLGKPIATYIQIERLADPFILLIERDDEGRWRYLRAQGVTPDDYRRMAELLDTPEELIAVRELAQRKVDEQLQATIQAMMQQGEHKAEDREKGSETEQLGTETRVDTETQKPTGGEDKDKDGKQTISLAPLEDVQVAGGDYPGGGIIELPKGRPPQPHPRKGGQVDWATREENKRQLGRRGEEIVYYKFEPNRLRQLGYTNAEIDRVLKWIAKDDEGADHDFESIDEDGHKIYIEVKSSAGEEDEFEMSVDEWRLAVAAGEQYYLYRVHNAASNSPLVWRYNNPAKMWQDKQLDFQVKQLTVRLPHPEKSDRGVG